jgi:GT2 family glycosyltransferase/2-polyprenyl-3-methyl-5-hydroxy-6-metoxy-1,4-benzoquinol methylase
MPDINSREWWDNYFAEVGEAHKGSNQQRHFMECLLANLSTVELSFLHSKPLHILEWGCAFGGGVEFLAQTFPQSQVIGLDFASRAIEEAKRRYPDREFILTDRDEILGQFDVIVSSNRLEHFENPLDLVATHLSSCEKLYIALVPDNEFPLSDYHRSQFRDESFPERLGDFVRLSSKTIEVDPAYWNGKQLLVVYGSQSYLQEREAIRNTDIERKKWDQYYASLPLIREDEAMRKFNAEFLQRVSELIPLGGEILEAGCGGGVQSLALARSGKFQVGLMDFSDEALNYARQLFERERVSAEFIKEDVFTPGKPRYDLVFNAGVLEHYTFDEQVAFLRGMASRSRKYVVTLVPNRLCYWYWLWRVQLSGSGEWSFGKEVPMVDLSASFEAAGLQFLGQVFMAESWTEFFVESLSDMDQALRRHILEIHRSPLIPGMQKCYLVAGLGSVAAETLDLPRIWEMPPLAEDMQIAEMGTALADALALRIGAERTLGQLQVQITEKEEALAAQVAEKEEARQALATQIAEKEQMEKEWQGQIVEKEQLLLEAQSQVRERDLVVRGLQVQLEEIHSSRHWRWVSKYWTVRSKLRQLADIRLLRRRVSRLLPTSVKRVLRKLLMRVGLIPSVLPRGDSDLSNGQSSVHLAELNSFTEPGRFDIVCLPIIEWHTRYQRPQQILTRFAADGHRVFYIAPETLVGGYNSIAEVDISLEPLGRNVALVKALSHTQLSIYRNKLEGRNLEYLFRAIELLKDRYDIANGVCLVQLPFWMPLAFQLREAFGWKIVYDCMDEHTGFSNNTNDMLQFEERLIRQSDLVVATARLLHEKVQQIASQSLLVPNAADFDHFNQRPAGLPLSSLPKPVIGYYGAIAEWFDMELIRVAVRAHPEWTFVLIGDTSEADDYTDLERASNVYFLGEKPYASLPSYLHSFDVCCIPFKLSSLTNSTNPVKFYEYISAGKPVVSVRLPELLPYEPNVYLADDPEDFVRKLERALGEDGPELREARLALARRNTWEMRYQKMGQAIKDLFELVSIVIVTWDNLALTKQCIESLMECTIYPNFEIILVDNASQDETPAYIQRLERDHSGQVKAILNSENKGFAYASNQGVEVATGSYVVFLNNDVVVSRGWLDGLLRHLEQPGVGAVGPVTNYCGNEARVPVSYSDFDEMQAFARERSRTFAYQFFETDVLGLFCLGIKRSILSEVGLLDERFGIGLFEDDDFSFRIRRQGYRLIVAEDVFVHHVGSASFQRLSQDEYRQVWNRNKVLFERKWDMPWHPGWGRDELTPEQGLSELLDAYPERKGVIVAPPTVDWGYMFQRPQQMALALARHGYLFFYCTSNRDVDRIQGFIRVAERLYVCQVPFEIFQEVPDLIALINGASNRRYLDHLSGCPVVIYEVLDDPDLFSVPDSQIGRDHTAMLETADVVVVSASRLLEQVKSTRPDAILCPDGVNLSMFLAAEERARQYPPGDLASVLKLAKPVVGYHGALSSWIDYDLIKHVARIKSDHVFVLIGPDQDGSLDNHHLTDIPNLLWLGPKSYHSLPYYLGHFDVGIIPVKVNHITQAVSPIGLFEYMASGIPIVSTGLAESRQYPEVLIADDAAKFAHFLDEALQRRSDPAWRVALQSVAHKHSWDERAAQLTQALDKIRVR